MGKITVVNNITLDGVMQAPARPDEDPRAASPTVVGQFPTRIP